MDKTATKILFSFDKTVNSEETLQAAVAIARKSNSSLHYILTEESALLGSGSEEDVVKDFKLKHGVQLEISKFPGNFWKGLAQAVEKLKATFVVVGATPAKAGLLGGGMSAKVDKLDCNMLFLNQNAKWQTPVDLVVPVDSSSETRQKFSPASHWAKLFYSNVTVLEVKKSDKGDDAKMSHVFAIQGNNYMVEKGLRTKVVELGVNAEVVSAVIEHTNNLRSKWITVMGNSEGILRVSAIQKICEDATCPLLIVPYREPIGLGGSGY
jgi:nucleotide-binding universal stress UspA family protein